jgi:hypothetical protein
MRMVRLFLLCFSFLSLGFSTSYASPLCFQGDRCNQEPVMEIPCSTVLQTYHDTLVQLERGMAPRSTWMRNLGALRRFEQEFPVCFGSREGLGLIQRRRLVRQRIKAQFERERRLRARGGRPTPQAQESYANAQELQLRRGRFWWGVELGGYLHFYMPMKLNPPSVQPFSFGGFLLGGRWGYAGGGFLITGDLFYATGTESFMVQFGATLGYMFNKYFTLEISSGINIIGAQGLENPEILLPLEMGITLRLPFATTSMGLRIVNSFAYDLGRDAIANSIRFNLIISSL